MSRYLDIEAEKSGSGHTTEEEDDDNNHSIDDIFDESSQPNDDVDTHRQVDNKLPPKLKPLRRTDSDQRKFLLAAHNDLLPASPLLARKSPSPVTAHAPAVRVDLTALASEESRGWPHQDKYSNCNQYEDALDWLTESPTPVSMEDDDHLSQTRRDTSASSSSTTTTTCTTTPTPTAPLSRGKFCLRHKKIGLTYAQCQLSPMYVCDYLRTHYSDYEPKLIIVSQEEHPTTDGKHLHAYIEFAKTFNSSDSRCLDIGIHHANIRTVTNSKQWTTYVCKGGDFYIYPQTARALYEPTHLAHYFNEQQQSNKKATISGQIVEEIKKGTPFSDLLRMFPGYMILHSRVVKQFIYLYQNAVILNENRKKWKTVVSFEGFNIPSMAIAGWLNDHLLKPHKFRSHNLWIKAPTQAGKTSLVEMLIDNGCIICKVDLTTHFYEDLDEDTQLLVFDEFKAQKTITEMNKMCDGSRSTVDTKNNHFNITKPLPVIVLSNFSIEEAYHNSDQLHLKTLIGRFLFIDMVDEKVRVQPTSMQN